MSIKKLFAMFMLLSFLAAANVLAEEDGQKYRDVFYPDGMPVKSFTMEGQTEYYPSVYELYDELDIPNNNLKVVVFTEKEAGYKYNDNKHCLFISIIQQNSDNWNIVYLREITKYITISGGSGRGDVQEINAVLNLFNVSGYDAVHLSLYALLSGRANISEDSDIFFIIQNSELKPALELKSDGGGGSGGWDYAQMDWTFIALSDVDSDDNIDIVTRKWKNIYDAANNNYVDEFENHLDVYQFDNAVNKYKLDGQLTDWPGDEIDLEQAGIPYVVEKD